jgi:hypothetical protein
MIDMLSATEFETLMGAKTFNLKQAPGGHWCVTSWATDSPTARVFWGCKTFLTLGDVEAHYVTFRGVGALLGVMGVAA